MSRRIRRAAAEFVGTGFLLAAIVGSGIMAERLSQGNVAVALLANAIATGSVLVAVILTFGPISGAHFNPAITLADETLSWSEVPSYIGAQVSGAFVGVFIAHVMFHEPAFTWSHHARAGFSQVFSEFVATTGLLAVVRGRAGALGVASYVVGAYWFTSSTCFANPAVTLARAATDTFAGIRPADVPAFVAAQLLAAGATARVFRWLLP